MSKLYLLVFTILALAFSKLHAGGPWLVYSAKESGTERSLLLLNLEDPQYSFKETDTDEDTWIHYNPKTKTVFRKIYLGGNEWHRLSWARSGKTFFVMYSQYENLTDGVSDHGVFIGTGSMVSWPNRNRNIGISGSFPSSLRFTYMQIGGNWNGSQLTTGTRFASLSTFQGNLEVAITKALNDARAALATNEDAKQWVIEYFTSPARGYTQTADVEE